jgi:serine phosphatase RsbU (regulator of sigma subunit)/lipopolysaccharide biosynthesis regulator YciM
VNAQSDSLYQVWKTAEVKDSLAIKALYAYSFPFIFNDADSAEILINELDEAATELNFNYWIGAAFNMKGILNAVQGNNKKAISHFEKCVEIYKDMGRDTDVSRANNNIGNVYRQQGHYSKAIEYFQLSSKFLESTGDKRMIAVLNNNVGILYKEMELFDKAEEYYNKSLKGHLELGNKKEVADLYNNLGTIFKQRKQLDSALHYFDKALDLYQEANHIKDQGNAYLNKADIYILQGQTQEAREAISFTLKVSRAAKDFPVESNAYATMGRLQLSIEHVDSAIMNCNKGYELATGQDSKLFIASNCKCLEEAYYSAGKYKKAYQFQSEYVEVSNYLSGEETAQDVAQKQFEFEIQKMDLADSIQREEEQNIYEAELAAKNALVETKKAEQYMLFIAIGFLILVALLILRSFRLKKRDNVTITLQKEIVEEKNREITDSINYAKRIQAAILPPTKLIKKHLPESFVLYLPKDIVAGDFYWLEVKDDKVLFAAADCTGHGVPGAMVSVVCNNGLNRSVREKGLSNPGQILDMTREIVIQEFEKSEEEVKDGMDIGLCALYKAGESLKANGEDWVLEFAGANNPLWIIRNSEILETKGDKQPIGKFGESTPFKSHNVDVLPGDTIYLCTDGFADQFGGDKGKKLKSSNFKKLLLSIQDLPMAQQKLRIEDAFHEWKGDLEQLDDVCIIGVRL